MKIGRNQPCPCGSGAKFKKCHLGREDELFLVDPEPVERVEIADTVPGVAEAIREAEHFWLESANSYNDPELFRVNLNALVQASRNVTFRVQSGKDLVPDFDGWYGPWQTFMKSDPVMRWLNEARIAVVKRSGLETRSTATARLIYSYMDAPEKELSDLPADLPNEELAAMLRQGVPSELLGNSAIEIERRWESDDFPGQELLESLAYAFKVLLALAIDLDAHLRGDPTCEPSLAVERTEMPRSLTRTRESRRLRIDTKTGAKLEVRDLWIPMTPIPKGAGPARYGLKADAFPETDDALEMARGIFRVASSMLKKDGYHIPLLLMHHPTSGWNMRELHLEDKLGKFVMWRRVAEEVEDSGYDGVVFVSEAWGSQQVPAPFESLEGMPDRVEFLAIGAATSDGRRLAINAEFHKLLGRVTKIDPAIEMEPDGYWFLSPVERAWHRGGFHDHLIDEPPDSR